MTSAAIEIRGLKVVFGDKVVLDGIDLSIDVGESVVLIGTSGSGKTVLLKSIIGLIRPVAGTIRLGGDDIFDGRHYARASSENFTRQAGVLFQQGALFDSLTIWENVAFRWLQSGEKSKEAARSAAVSKLIALGLDEQAADLFPSELSGGMRKRAALERAIAADPPILLLDDPVAGLDPILTAGINLLIKRSVQDLQASALTITPNLATMKAVGDRVVMIEAGRIVWTGPVDRLESSGNAYVDQFVRGRSTGPIRIDAN